MTKVQLTVHSKEQRRIRNRIDYCWFFFYGCFYGGKWC